MNFLSDNVTKSAPLRFKSVDDIRGTELFDLYFHTFITTGHMSIKFAHETGNYFEHNRFWLNQDEVPTIHLRYEDMIEDALSTMAPVSQLLGVEDADMRAALGNAATATKPTGKFFWKQKEKNYLVF